MYNFSAKQWHSVYSDVEVSAEVPEVVTLSSISTALSIPVVELKSTLEGLSVTSGEIVNGDLAKQWFNTDSNLGAIDVCTLSDLWRIMKVYDM